MTAAPGWGLEEPSPEPWRSGRWALARVGDELVDVAFDDRPVLRSLRVVVRDSDWRTVPPTVEATDSDCHGLRIRLRFAGLGADLRGDLLVGVGDDRLTASLRLRSGTAFDRNRIGLVVLHAAEVSGAPLVIRHVDGSRTNTHFPDRISPHQPALDVAALAWKYGGVHADLAFEGDAFEMEDQRNWTDASFKTYSTPLREPFPVRIYKGLEIRQSLLLVCSARDSRDSAPIAEVDADVVLAPRGGRLPVFSLGATTEAGALGRADGAALLVEIDADSPNRALALARAAEEAVGGALDVRLVTDRPESVRAVVDELARLDGRAVTIVRTGVYSPIDHVTGAATWRALQERAAACGLTAELVGGTRAHFTELNRRHADLPEDLPALTFSSTPQMHAVESRQLIESIDMQRLTAQDATRIAGGRPVHIGPVTLRPRFNAVSTSAGERMTGVAAGSAPLDPDATDARQGSAALAAWLIASAAAFAVPGVATVSWFEASGPRGVRCGGVDLPVRAAVVEVLELAGADALDTSSLPLGVHVLAGAVGVRTIALVANMRHDQVTIVFRVADEARTVTVPPLEHRRIEWRAG